LHVGNATQKTGGSPQSWPGRQGREPVARTVHDETFPHLGNLSLAKKSRIEWDAATEHITNNEEANKLLHYDYRGRWKLQ
jgi:hypothetical protein